MSKWKWSFGLMALWLFNGAPLLSQGGISEQIAFVSDRDGNKEIYLINADGGALTNLTTHPAEDTSPAWSPDGMRMAFVSDRNGTPQIFVIDADGSGLFQLTEIEPPGGQDFHYGEPVWSPDGSRIAFSTTTYRMDQLDIYWIDSGGGDSRRVYSDSGHGGRITWSPDGQQLLFDSFAPGNFDLFMVNMDGSDLHPFASGVYVGGPLNGKASWELEPAWSPDGDRIAFVTDRVGGAVDIFVTDPEGHQPRNLTLDSGANAGPVWSPDGRWLAFTGGGFSGAGLHITDPASGETSLLSVEPYYGVDFGQSWSPDGSHIVYAVREDDQNDIYVVAVDGSGRMNLTSHPANDSDPAWRPMPVMPPLPLPLPAEAGRTIAFIRDGNIWTISVDGTNEQQVTTGGRYADPAWSPDGELLAFVRRVEVDQAGKEASQIGLLDASTTEERVVVEATPTPFVLEGTYYRFQRPKWSPDGRYLYFLASDGRVQGDSIRRVDVTTGEQVEGIVPFARAFDVSSGDGALVYTIFSNAPPAMGYGLNVADANGAFETELLPIRDGISIWDLCWSNGGAQVIFATSDGQEARVELIEIAGARRDILLSNVRADSIACSLNTEALVYESDGMLWAFDPAISELRELTIGASPSWGRQLEAASSINAGIDEAEAKAWLAEKSELVRQLEYLDIPTSLFTIPGVSAYDESAARRLLDQIQDKLDEGSLSSEELEAFSRLVLQERALAGLLPSYVGIAATISDTATDTIETALGLLNSLKPGWNKCKQVILFCGYVQASTERMVWRLIRSFTRTTSRLLTTDPEQGETAAKATDLILRLVEDGFSVGKSLRDLLADTGIQILVTDLIVREMYLPPTQQLVDKGVISADLSTSGAERWPVAGTVDRAELLMEHYVEQAAIEEQAALERHLSFQDAADFITFAEDLADIATLSPAGFVAKAVSLGARLEHLFLINIPLTYANYQNLECVHYLSTRAPEAAFLADQPFDTCRDRIGALHTTFASPSPVVYRPRSASSLLQTSLAEEAEAYLLAIERLVAAVQSRDNNAVEKAFGPLGQAEAPLMSSLDEIQAVLLAQDTLGDSALAFIEQDNAFTLSSVNLYLGVTEWLLSQQADTEPETDVEALAQEAARRLGDLVSAAEQFDLAPLPGEPILVVGDVVAESTPEQLLSVDFWVRNVGGAPTGDAKVTLSAADETIAPAANLGQMATGEGRLIKLAVNAAGADTYLIQVWNQDELVYSYWDGITAVLPTESAEGEEAEPTTSPVEVPEEAPETEPTTVIENSHSQAGDDDSEGLFGLLIGNSWLPLGAIAIGGLLVVSIVGIVLWRRSRTTTAVDTSANNQYCIYCGAEYPPTGKFCIKCGRLRE